MMDYSKSIEQGLAAAELASNANREIDGILEAVRVALNSAIKGGSFILKPGVPSQFPKESIKKMPTARSSLGSAFLGIAAVMESSAISWTDAVEALTVESSECGTATLCEFLRSSDGYPVVVRYSTYDILCPDRKTLERILSEMLKHSETGRILRPFVQQNSASQHSHSPAP